jgi:hypothetical protein
MIEQASLIIGDGNWAVKSDSLLGYALPQGKYVPREMSVVRATTGTRVNEAGLVELVPYNLVTYSNDISNADWGKFSGDGGTAPIVTANYGVSPSGLNNASRIQLARTSSSGSYSVIRQSITILPNTNYRQSVWLKSLSGTPSILIADNGGVFLNLITLTTDWVRYELPFSNSFNFCNFDFALSQNIAGSSLSADFLVYGAQLVEGTQPLDYLPTTTRLNIPRIDYSTGSAALLVEPQRTNLLTYSNDFTNAVYYSQDSTLTPNFAISPDGTQNATKITATNTDPLILQNIYSGFVTTYTMSIYAKGVGSTIGKTCRFFIIRDAFLEIQTFDFQLTSEWQRFTATFTLTAVPLTNVSYRVDLPNTSVVVGDQVLIYGAQFEAGSYATSYIPTTSASVTRNADQISKTGISSLIGQTEGTIFMDFTLLPNNSNNSYLFSISDGSTNNIIRSEIYVDSPSIYQFRTGIVTLGVSQGDAFTNITQPNNKMAISYKLNEVKIFLNGVLVATDTSVTIPATSQVHIGNRNNTDLFIGSYYKSFVLFPTALTNAQLAQLTTL